MATDVLATVWDLAVKVKKAHEGVQGNSKQCTRLSVLVESVAFVKIDAGRKPKETFCD